MAASEGLEELVGEWLTARGETLAVAESCSGGLIAHRITNVPGSSSYFLGGLVAYSNDVKAALLGVSPAVLEEHGAVSEPVARQMVEGVRDRFGSDFGAAVTGIAGPGGGSAEKPVGLVYIAVAGNNGSRVERCHFSGDREEVKAQTAETALKMLLEILG